MTEGVASQNKIGRAAFRIIALAVVLGLSLLGVHCWVLPKVILRFVASATDLKVSGPIRSEILKSDFVIDPVYAEWDQKIRVSSGQVKVGYSWNNLITFEIRLVLDGKQVSAQLLGDWERIVGQQSVVFSNIQADLIIDRRGIREIKALRAESPTYRFQFGEASNRRLRVADEA